MSMQTALTEAEWLRSLHKWQTDPLGVLYWAEQMQLRTEFGHPLDWYTHRFLVQPLCDMHPRQVTMKCTQIGKSVADLLKATFLAQVMGRRVIYTLPTARLLGEFHKTKIDLLYQANPQIAPPKDDTQGAKLWENGYIVFRGTMGEQQALSLTADTLIHDEAETSNQHALQGMTSRTDKAENPFHWWSGNPWRPNMQLHKRWQMSDQHIWHVTCPHCHHEQPLTFEDNICRRRKAYVCRKCDEVLPNETRIMGRWIATKPGAEWRGYHFNQLMSPWKTAASIIEAEETNAPDIFYRFTLGLPYAGPASGVDPDVLLMVRTDEPPHGRLRFMGVDVGRLLHVTIGDENGITDLVCLGGHDKWSVLNRLMAQHQINLCVIDNGPEDKQKTFQSLHPGKVLRCIYTYDEKGTKLYWRDRKQPGVIYADRTRIIDDLIAGYSDGKIAIYLDEKHEYLVGTDKAGAENCMYDHWSALYESGVTGEDLNIVKKDRMGNVIRTWEATGDDHWVHSNVYYWLARYAIGLPFDDKSAFVPGTVPELSRTPQPDDEYDDDDDYEPVTDRYEW